MYNHNISKSTKRRTLLEELETVNFLIDDQPELGPQPSCSSYEIPFMSSSESSNNLITESNILNQPLDATEKNNFVHSSFSITSDSSSDESICHEINMLDIFDEEQSILNSLAKWTVNYSITSESFSSLLKILKGHSCFNNFKNK